MDGDETDFLCENFTAANFVQIYYIEAAVVTMVQRRQIKAFHRR
jgi:hypothetical protein